MESPSPEVLRTFVALVPCEATALLLAAEGERIARADPAARAVPKANLHLTLLFLGNTPVTAIPSITQALERALVGFEPIRLRPTSLGAFPPSLEKRGARVVFASVAPEAHEALARLAARVTDAVAEVVHPFGAAGGTRGSGGPFHPHLTIARRDVRRGARSGHGPDSPSPALKRMLTEGALQSTYTDEMISDVRLLISESPVSESSHVGGGAGAGGRTYRVLASIPLGPSRSTANASSPPIPRMAVSRMAVSRMAVSSRMPIARTTVRRSP